ncbi:DUF4400 domain-containing protein [Geoalkalibacter subterraneus]|uniref:DUF4400 domain-containing protein n=1 Tax=Geoalkalibacter subterraneus TaxID=483547 RepID=A0A0B5FWZ8_9BACT|nr:DUF4400 domain-containing protein [Geoalkalibacter subterraneus]AJF08126.1 hypothetical protein GSUB_16585 [Geoalkalibacter subterraneus]
MPSKEKQNNQKPRHPIFVFLTFFLVVLGLVFLFVPKTMLASALEKEQQVVASSLGEKTAKRIKADADAWYVASFIETGMLHATYDFLIGQWDQEGDLQFDDRGIGKWSEQRLDTTWLVLYLVYYRVAVITTWLPYLFPFLLAVGIDSVAHREISKWRFSFSSPLAHSSGLKGIYGSIFILLTLPFLPIAPPPMTTPFVFMVIAIFMWLCLANVHKRV